MATICTKLTPFSEEVICGCYGLKPLGEGYHRYRFISWYEDDGFGLRVDVDNTYVDDSDRVCLEVTLPEFIEEVDRRIIKQENAKHLH